MVPGAPAKPRPPEGGQASVELIALLPALLLCVALAAQVLAAGWALWAAGNAARAGARAEHAGADGEAVARRALPGRLRDGALIRADDGVRVRVPVPALLPGAELPAVTAASRLDADGDGR
jgi:hypothetical protein